LLLRGEETVNSTGLVIDRFGRASDRDYLVPRARLERAAGPVPGVSGGAVLLRCAALARVGLFDPDYFAYYEDVDLSLRAAALGIGRWYCSNAVARHRFGATFGPGSPQQRYLLGKNHLRTLALHQPALWACALVPATVAWRLGAKAPLELLRGHPQLALAEVRAGLEGALAATRALPQRWRGGIPPGAEP
jgi:GT2 family glycosyltransferase